MLLLSVVVLMCHYSLSVVALNLGHLSVVVTLGSCYSLSVVVRNLGSCYSLSVAVLNLGSCYSLSVVAIKSCYSLSVAV